MAVYQRWLQDVITGALGSASIKAMLVTATYAQDPSHHYRADISDEISGSGYTTGGVAVTGVAVNADDGLGEVMLNCDDVVFGSLGATDIAGIIFYVDTGSSATDVLVAADLFGPVDTSTLQTYTYTPDAAGIVCALQQ